MESCIAHGLPAGYAAHLVVRVKSNTTKVDWENEVCVTGIIVIEVVW